MAGDILEGGRERHPAPPWVRRVGALVALGVLVGGGLWLSRAGGAGPQNGGAEGASPFATSALAGWLPRGKAADDQVFVAAWRAWQWGRDRQAVYGGPPAGALAPLFAGAAGGEDFFVVFLAGAAADSHLVWLRGPGPEHLDVLADVPAPDLAHTPALSVVLPTGSGVPDRPDAASNAYLVLGAPGTDDIRISGVDSNPVRAVPERFVIRAGADLALGIMPTVNGPLTVTTRRAGTVTFSGPPTVPGWSPPVPNFVRPGALRLPDTRPLLAASGQGPAVFSFDHASRPVDVFVRCLGPGVLAVGDRRTTCDGTQARLAGLMSRASADEQHLDSVSVAAQPTTTWRVALVPPS